MVCCLFYLGFNNGTMSGPPGFAGGRIAKKFGSDVYASALVNQVVS